MASTKCFADELPTTQCCQPDSLGQKQVVQKQVWCRNQVVPNRTPHSRLPPAVRSSQCSQQLSCQGRHSQNCSFSATSPALTLSVSKHIYTVNGRRKGKGKRCTRLCCFCIPISSFTVPFNLPLQYLSLSSHFQ